MKEFTVNNTDSRLRVSSPHAGVWRFIGAGGGEPFDDLGAAQFLSSHLSEKIDSQERELGVSGGSGSFCLDCEGERICLGVDERGISAEIPSLVRLSFDDLGADTKISGSLSAGERIYGTGERFNSVCQRGKKLRMWAVDEYCHTEGNSYVPVPFFISSSGYAVFYNRFETCDIDLGTEEPGFWRLSARSAPLDLYLFTGSGTKILNDLSRLTGFAPMPDDWVFGIQVSRHGSTGEFARADGVYAMSQEMKKRGLPWDAVILEGWDTYNTGTYPELERLCGDLHRDGKQVLMYDACGRVNAACEADDGFRNEYLIHGAEDVGVDLPCTRTDNPKDAPNCGTSRFIDITDPQALAWWQDKIWGRLVSGCGVQGSKIDFCEQLPDYVGLRFSGGEKEAGAHHWYPTLYNCLMYRYFKRKSPYGAMNFSRGGYTGAQRYPLLWCGDQRREFHFLRSQLTAMLSAGLSGIPFMSHDAAGYQPADDQETDPEPLVFVRGIEFACFTVNIETHGQVTRPYDFDDRTVDIYRVYTELHEALRPYIMEAARISCATGLPLMRHLFLYDSGDEGCLDAEDEYMFGPSFLVAPVLDRDGRRDIYLPRGRWMDLAGGGEIDGGITLRGVEVPDGNIPVFMLADAEGEALRASSLIAAALKEAGGTAG